MTPAQQAILDSLQDQFDQINAAFNATDMTTLTPDQATAFGNAVATATSNLTVASNEILAADEDTLQHISGIIQAAQQTVDNGLKDLANIATQINLVANAVSTVTTAISVLH